MDGDSAISMSKMDSPEPAVFESLCDRAGNLWFVTQNGGLFKIPATGFRIPEIEVVVPPGPAALIGHALAEVENQIKFSTPNGLSILTDTGPSPFPANDNLHEPHLESLVQDDGGLVWLGSRSAPLQS